MKKLPSAIEQYSPSRPMEYVGPVELIEPGLRIREVSDAEFFSAVNGPDAPLPTSTEPVTSRTYPARNAAELQASFEQSRNSVSHAHACNDACKDKRPMTLVNFDADGAVLSHGELQYENNVPYIRTSYTVFVSGRAWGGFDADMQYEFDHLPTAQDVKSKAGDFQDFTIDDVIKTVTTTIQTGLDVSVIK